MNARQRQHPNHVTARYADPSLTPGKRVEFLQARFDRITDEHCARCGSRGTLWGDGDDARLCTTCGTQYRFEQLPEPVTAHWVPILGAIRKAAGEGPRT